MEFVQKYWYVIAGALVLVLLLSRRSSGASGPTVTQIGGGAEALALAQLQSQDALAADQQKFGFVQSLLGYGLETDRTARADAIERLRIESGERVAIRQAQASETAAQYQQNLATQSLSYQQAQANLNYQLQLEALRRQGGSSTLQTILGGIFGGLDRALPIIDTIWGNDDNDWWDIFGGGGSGGGGWGGGWTFGW